MNIKKTAFLGLLASTAFSVNSVFAAATSLPTYEEVIAADIAANEKFVQVIKKRLENIKSQLDGQDGKTRTEYQRELLEVKKVSAEEELAKRQEQLSEMASLKKRIKEKINEINTIQGQLNNINSQLAGQDGKTRSDYQIKLLQTKQASAQELLPKLHQELSELFSQPLFSQPQ